MNIIEITRWWISLVHLQKHNSESCPMNNLESKKVFLELKDKLKKISQNINNYEAFYMSVLEHEWIITFKAKNACDIESVCIEAELELLIL